MRTVRLAAGLVLCGLVGCGSKPDLRPDPVEVKVSVKLASGSAKDLTITFQPLGQMHPAGGVIGADGTVTVKATPGKYSFYFPPEPNGKSDAFKQIPEKYRSANAEHAVELSAGTVAVVEVK